MQRALDQFFKDAVNRKPKRLSFDTTYSHTNIYDWLQTILTDWTIIIPGSSCSEFAIIFNSLHLIDSNQIQFQYKCLVIVGSQIRYQEYMPDIIWKNVPNNIRNV